MKVCRFLILLAVPVCLAAALLVSASAATYGGNCGEYGSNVTWSLDTDTGVLTVSGTGEFGFYMGYAPWYSYCGSIKTVIIEYGVTNIGINAFEDCSALTSVTIPSSVTSIDDYAFGYCSSLTSIAIPYGVTSIGEFAFESCTALTSIEIPNSVTIIGDSAFYECSSLDTITIPESVTSIGSAAFCFCSSLTSITIPKSVTSIGFAPFCGCSALTAIAVADDNTAYSVDSFGILFNKDKTELIQYPVGNTRTEYMIPNSVNSIGEYAFATCDKLTAMIISNSVTSIGDYAFEYCESLTEITIPNSVNSIGEYAFESYSELTILCHENSTASSYASNNSIPVRHIHFYEWTVIEEPTFEKAGTEGGECTVCHHKTTREISPIGARLTQKSITAATYTASGESTIRFITRLEVAEGVTVAKFGTYISLVSFNEDGTPSSAGARVVAKEQTVSGAAPTSFALDLTGIPADQSATKVYAWAFAEFSDGTRVSVAFDAATVAALVSVQ